MNFTVAMRVVQFVDRISHHTDYIRSGDFHLWVVLTTKTRQSPQLNLRRRTHHEHSVTSAGHSMPNFLFSQISGTLRKCPESTCELLLAYSLVYFFFFESLPVSVKSPRDPSITSRENSIVVRAK